MFKFLDKQSIKDKYNKLVSRIQPKGTSPDKPKGQAAKTMRAVSAPKPVKQIEFKRAYPNGDLPICVNPDWDLQRAVTTSKPPAFGFPIIDYCTDS